MAETTDKGAAHPAASPKLDITPSGFTGKVTTSDHAALAEQNALADLALDAVAEYIVLAAEKACNGANVYLSAATAPPSRSAAQVFEFQRRLVERALADALGLAGRVEPLATKRVEPASPQPEADLLEVADLDKRANFIAGAAALGTAAATVASGPLGLAVGAIGAAGTVLSGLNALISYARSDYALGGEVLQPSERALLCEVGQHLKDRKKTVRLDGFAAPLPKAEIDALAASVGDLANAASAARGRAAEFATTIKRLTPAGDGKTLAPDPDKDDKLPAFQQAEQALKDAVALFDDFVKALAADHDGAPMILRVGEARALDAFLSASDASILLIKLDGAFGSTCSEQNIVASLRGHPNLQVAAFVTASWQCLSGASLELLAAGVERRASPFTTITKVADLIDGHRDNRVLDRIAKGR